MAIRMDHTTHTELPHCAWCAQIITGCDGRHGDWMHADTRTEHCADDPRRLAWPETFSQRRARVGDQIRCRRARHAVSG